MFDIVVFIMAIAGVLMVVGGSVVAYVEQEWNNIGVVGAAMLLIGLVLLYKSV